MLLWGIVLLTMVGNYLTEARGGPTQIAFGMEQPATLKEYMPEIVSFWDTKEWPAPKKEFGWKEVTFHQGAKGGAATKPTTFGGNLGLELNKHKRFEEGADKGEIKTSKDLSRWAPGVMSKVAEALMVQVMRQEPNLRPLSWDEQLTAILHTGGTMQPANRQCSSATHIKKFHIQEECCHWMLPGHLSLPKTLEDYAHWMLVGTLTWAVPVQ